MASDDEYGQAYAKRAESNIEEWGLQSKDTLLLCMQEELGELTQAYLEHRHEGGDKARIEHELVDLMALCLQLQWKLRREAGESVPYFLPDDTEGDQE